MRLKVDQRAGQLSLPHLGITKTEKIELECSKLNRHVQMKVAERGMNNSDEEF